MLSIKKAAISDIQLIRDLALQVWPPTYTPIVGPEQVVYMLDLFYSAPALRKQMEELHHRFILCFDEDMPVGFAAYSEVEPHLFKLHKLYVLTGQQGKGIGRLMITYIAAELKKENVTSLILNVNRFNSSAIAFYDKTGFRHHTDEDIDIGNGFFMNDHVLELPLG